MWDFLFKIMEVLDKDNKIRKAIPITGTLWIIFLCALYLFIVNVVVPFYGFFAEANSKPIDSWTIVNVVVIAFLIITAPLCFYSVYASFQATKERKKWEKIGKTMEKDSTKLQEVLKGSGEMILRAEKAEKEKNEEYKKVKGLVQKAQSIVDELKRRKRNES